MVNTIMLARFSAQRLHYSPRHNSFRCIVLPTLLHSQKSQTLCNQANPGSFCKIPGVGYPECFYGMPGWGGHPECLYGTPGVAYLPASTFASTPSVLSVNSVVNRLSAGMYPRPAPDLRTTPFRINTCKSVSKQRTLSPSRMNTYEKTGEGGTPSSGFPRPPEGGRYATRRQLSWCGLLLGRCLYLVR